MNRIDFVSSKIISLHEAEQRAAILRLKNQRIIFTNGCFDLLHLGHITYLSAAASLGDKLFVAINDDASVRSLNKGADRPINPELSRAMVLASLGFIDYVVVFSEATPLETLMAIQPDVVVKGGDYDAEITDESDKKYIVGKKEAAAWGGSVQTIPLVPGYSTTLLLSKK
jgi:rfaE bifunctional protein nucleotidyltransferase chain/domain